MAYLKPPWFTRTVFNKIAMATGLSGTEVLTVTTRRSGQPQRVPVIPVDLDGTTYLVSTRGESEWVKNLRADPNLTLGTSRYVAAEIPETDRGPVLAAYRKKAGHVDGYFTRLPSDADHPVFALTPPSAR